MIIRVVLPILAALGILLGIAMVYYGSIKPPTPPIEYQPARSPYEHFVAGSGIVEAASENISIGSTLNGIVSNVYTEAGDYVEKGCPLFKLDTSYLEAQLLDARTNYLINIANLQKQLALPRPEEVPPQQALVAQAAARLKDQQAQLALYQRVTNRAAISENEFNQRLYAFEQSQASLDEAQSRLDLLKAGAWIRDIEIYRQQVSNAEAKIKIIEANLELSTIRAPMRGRVLQMNIRLGEFAGAAFTTTPMVLFGSVDPYHIRVDIDEVDAWRVIPGASGTAFVRGNSAIKVPLDFVRIEPYVTPKQSLTGDNTERVDTRVLQIIYRFDPKNRPIYMGQLMDIFLESRPNQI